jgi:hypothetical protein
MVCKVLDDEAKKHSETVQQYRTKEGMRLEALILALWPKAMDGSTDAHNAIGRHHDRICRLFGLNQQVEAADVIVDLANKFRAAAALVEAEETGEPDAGEPGT